MQQKQSGRSLLIATAILRHIEPVGPVPPWPAASGAQEGGGAQGHPPYTHLAQ